MIIYQNSQNGLKRPDSMLKCSEDPKKVLNMSLSQTVLELGLIIKRVLRPFGASSIQEHLIHDSENTVCSFEMVSVPESSLASTYRM